MIVSSLGDMILSARDRKMIANECLLYDCFELRIYDCSLGDMILSARDRKMIAMSVYCMIVLSSGFMIVLLVIGFFRQGTVR